MPRRRELVVSLTPLGADRPGAWCDACALPSAIDTTIGIAIGGRPSSIKTWRWCADCHRTVRT